MYKKGDFHIHSTYSDGKLTPREIVELAKKREVDIISITDHNNTGGIDEAIEEGKRLGVKVIPGVELSTRYNNSRVHVLGYFNDDSYKNELLNEILFMVKHRKVSEIKSLFRGSIDFKKCKNKLCVEAGIDILKFFGATVVLAHPVLLNKNDFNNIINMKFDGVEARYFLNTEEDTEYFINIAKDRNLVYTAGSDFHNCIEYYRIHGIIGDVYLDSNEIEIFLNKLNKNN